MQKFKMCLLTACLLAGATSNAFAKPDKPKTQTLSYTCRVVYEPTGAMWVRELEIDYDKKKFIALRIDGVKAHGFAADGASISTHLDNERIELDMKIPQWKSTFREAAQGQGVCIKNR